MGRDRALTAITTLAVSPWYNDGGPIERYMDGSFGELLDAFQRLGDVVLVYDGRTRPYWMDEDGRSLSEIITFPGLGRGALTAR